MTNALLTPTQTSRLDQLKRKYDSNHENYQHLRHAEFLLREGDWLHQANNLVIWPDRKQQVIVEASGQAACSCGKPEKCAHRFLAWITDDPNRVTESPPHGEKPSLKTLYQRFQQAAYTTPVHKLPDSTRTPYFPWEIVNDTIEHVTGGHWSSRVVHRTSEAEQALVTVGLTIHCKEADVYRESMAASDLHPKTRDGKPIQKSEENAFHKAERRAFKRAAGLFGFRLPSAETHTNQ